MSRTPERAAAFSRRPSQQIRISCDEMSGLPLRAADVALRRPDLLRDSATVGEVRAFFAASAHRHLALLVDDRGLLVATVAADDVPSGADPRDRARGWGSLVGRTVPWDTPEPAVRRLLTTTGSRRVAVVDEDGHVVGLVCLKRSGKGFCTDEGVEARRESRSSSATSAR